MERFGHPNNFVLFRPKKDFVNVEPRLEKTDEIDKLVEGAGLDMLAYDKRSGRCRIRVDEDALKMDAKVLTDLIHGAYDDG